MDRKKELDSVKEKIGKELYCIRESSPCVKGGIEIGKERFYRGDPYSQIMVVGEESGFIGEPGVLLDKMFNAIGLDRNDLYVTNILKCHISGDRASTREEGINCYGILGLEISIVDPLLIVMVGGVVAKLLYSKDVKIIHEIGNIVMKRIEGRHRYLHFLYHPTYVKRKMDNGDNKARKEQWESLKNLQGFLKISEYFF